MYASLSLEAIGDDTRQHVKLCQKILISAGGGALAPFYAPARPAPYVARITGVGGRLGIVREFVRGRKDYSAANSTGSRGIRIHYMLPPGVYEVQEILSWRDARRYFVRSDGGRLAEIDREEALRCLPSVD